MDKILITGGAGFVGTHLVDELLRSGKNKIVVFDKLVEYPDKKNAGKIEYVKGNIINKSELEELFKNYGNFSTIYHLAAEMPNKLADERLMFATNVDGTTNLIENAVKNKVKNFIFTSSNVTYGIPKKLPVDESTPLNPIEHYGKSKARAEEVLAKFKNKINIQIFRCPVITGTGRLGLQAVLYGFISENKRVYVLGNGNNIYQFIDVVDAVLAFIKSSKVSGFDIYVIGADEVLTLRELYQKVIDFAGSSSKIQSLPFGLAMRILTFMDKINFSPLGVYQIAMMGRSIYADTSKIKKKLGWQPTKTNADTFIENYKWYIQNRGKFSTIGGEHDSPNRSIPKLGIIRIIKFFS